MKKFFKALCTSVMLTLLAAAIAACLLVVSSAFYLGSKALLALILPYTIAYMLSVFIALLSLLVFVSVFAVIYS